MARASRILATIFVFLGAVSVVLSVGERLAWDKNFRSVLLIFDGEGYTKLSNMGIPVRIPDDSAIGVNEVTLRFLKEAGYAYSLASGAGSFRRLEIVFPRELLLLDELPSSSGEEQLSTPINNEDLISRILEYRIRKSLSYQLAGSFEAKARVVKNTVLIHLRLPMVPEESENVLSLGFYLKPIVVYPQRYGFVFRPSGNGVFDASGVKEKMSFIPKTSKTLPLIIFFGDKVLGYPDELKVTAERIEGKLGVPEFTQVKGLRQLINSIQSEKVLWLHSIPPEETARMSVDEIVFRFLRALKERNPRLLYIHPILESERIEVVGSMGETILQANERMISELRTRIKNDLGYQFSTEISNPSSSKTLLLRPLSMLLGYLLILWFIFLVFPGSGIGRLLWSAPIQILFLVLFFLSELSVRISGVLVVLVSLFVAIFAPVVGVICGINYCRTHQSKASLESEMSGGITFLPRRHALKAKLFGFMYPIFRSLVAFGIVLLICLGAGLLIYAIYHGVAVFAKTQVFRGVMLSRLLPALLVLIYYYNFNTIGFASQQRNLYIRLKRLFSYPLSYGDLALLFILFAGLALVFMRAGNEFGFLVSAPEMNVRSTLEVLFGVRPRNLEILGHAGLLLFLILLPKFHKASLLLLAVGSLGMSTLINTFTHFHTPLLVSALRVSIGVFLGIVLFLVIYLAYGISRKLAIGLYLVIKRVS